MNFILTWIVGWASICYVCLIQDFIEMWLGDRYKYDSIITIVLFGIYFYSWKIRSVNVRYKEAAGMWNDDFWKPYVAAIVNVVINIILVNIIGIDGVLISTIIAMIFINLPWETFVLCRNLFEVSTKEFYIELIYRTLCVCITGLVTYKICAFIHMELLLGFLIKIIICIFIPNILLLVVLRKDKEYINSMKYVRRIIYSAKN
jgi:O-antigen/teichoic acid export membrane protein